MLPDGWYGYSYFVIRIDHFYSSAIKDFDYSSFTYRQEPDGTMYFSTFCYEGGKDDEETNNLLPDLVFFAKFVYEYTFSTETTCDGLDDDVHIYRFSKEPYTPQRIEENIENFFVKELFDFWKKKGEFPKMQIYFGLL